MIATEIRRLAPERIVIAGGTSAISAGVEKALRALAPQVTRAAGADRYETSELLIRLAFPTAEPEPEAEPAPGAGADAVADCAGPRARRRPRVRAPTPPAPPAAPRIYVATGGAFPDALSGGALAATEGAPLVVVPGSKSTLSAATRTLLRDLGTTSATVLGGPTAVSDGIVSALRAQGIRVDRAAGADRYGTSLAVAKRFPKGASALIALGTNFPDALSAVSLAAVRTAPIILNTAVCARSELRSYVASHAPATLTTIGGPSAVRGLVGSLTPCQSTTAAGSIWVMVNKKHPLKPIAYAPSPLKTPTGTPYAMRKDAADAFNRMSAAVRAAGAGRISTASAYRPYSSQKRLYNGYIATRGRAWADVHSARPGYSEHQTGLTADVIVPGAGGIYGFAGTKQQKWVAANAWRYGFIVRYENGYTAITGYTSEPWHLRYVGTALAADYHAGGFHTLEQYLGYPAARNY